MVTNMNKEYAVDAHQMSVLLLSVPLVILLFLISACGSGDEASSDTGGDSDVTQESDVEGDADESESDNSDGDSETTNEEQEEDLSEETEESETETEVETEDSEENGEDDLEEVTMRCNGFEELCARRFNEVAYVTTHNSMSNTDDGWIAPNQVHNIQTQLTDGVRGFMLDTYIYEGQPWLCHGDCRYGKKLMVEALSEMKDFLDSNPNEILTIIFESYISPIEAETVFEESGLIDYVYAPAPEQTEWPTLEEMINANHKMVVFTSPWDAGAPDWYLEEWRYCWETPWHVTELEGFDCSINNGSQENDVFILNHFLYGNFDLPTEELSAQANANPFLYERASSCLEETGRMPNFITVNHYSIGDVFEAVNQLNGVE